MEVEGIEDIKSEIKELLIAEIAGIQEHIDGLNYEDSEMFDDELGEAAENIKTLERIIDFINNKA